MAALLKLPLAPFALLFRLSFANPVAAILLSAAAGLVALLIGQLNWMALALCFSAYIIIWWSENDAVSPVAVVAKG